MVYILNMMIFHGYVKLPDGIYSMIFRTIPELFTEIPIIQPSQFPLLALGFALALPFLGLGPAATAAFSIA